MKRPGWVVSRPPPAYPRPARGRDTRRMTDLITPRRGDVLAPFDPDLERARLARLCARCMASAEALFDVADGLGDPDAIAGTARDAVVLMNAALAAFQTLAKPPEAVQRIVVERRAHDV